MRAMLISNTARRFVVMSLTVFVLGKCDAAALSVEQGVPQTSY